MDAAAHNKSFERNVKGYAANTCYINVTNRMHQIINVTRLSSLFNLIVTLINLINVTHSPYQNTTKRQNFTNSLGGIHYF